MNKQKKKPATGDADFYCIDPGNRGRTADSESCNICGKL